MNRRNHLYLFIGIFLFMSLSGFAQMNELNDSSEWKDISEFIPSATLDIRYATTNNFTKTEIYDCAACFLRTRAAVALKNVASELNEKGYSLVLFDCYRPAAYQEKLWEVVPNPNYVAPPDKGSIHSRGLAVDLSILDENGEQLEMGTGYDYFGEEAHQDYTDLPDNVLKNRKFLKNLMMKHGFSTIRTEWWHFNFGSDAEEKRMVWDCKEE